MLILTGSLISCLGGNCDVTGLENVEQALDQFFGHPLMGYPYLSETLTDGGIAEAFVESDGVVAGVEEKTGGAFAITAKDLLFQPRRSVTAHRPGLVVVQIRSRQYSDHRT